MVKQQTPQDYLKQEVKYRHPNYAQPQPQAQNYQAQPNYYEQTLTVSNQEQINQWQLYITTVIACVALGIAICVMVRK